MKKSICKLFSILLCALFLAAALLPGMRGFTASAAGEDGRPVAVIYLCIPGIHLPYIFGHAWICISNVSNETLTVGPQTLAPGEMLSVGLHAGGGMAFNREMGEYRGSSVSAIQRQISREDLQRAETEILNSKWNYYLLFSHNCTNFASAVWKAATGESFRTGVFPFVLKSQLPSDQTVSLYIG